MNTLISTSDYLPGKESLLVDIDMSTYLIDYYLHRRQVAPETTPEQDDGLKELIACFAFHLAARPPTEDHAWTVHLVAEQPYSLFVTGTTGPLSKNGEGVGAIVGNILTENIRYTDVNSLHAQFTVKNGEVFKSYIRSESSKISEVVESFYNQSEQNPIRIFYSDTSDRSLALVALPDWDRDWFHSVSLESLLKPEEIPLSRPIKRMRNCQFEFRCDCSPDKLLPFFRSLSPEEVKDLYAEDDDLIISCPRCGKFFPINRSLVDRPG